MEDRFQLPAKAIAHLLAEIIGPTPAAPRPPRRDPGPPASLAGGLYPTAGLPPPQTLPQGVLYAAALADAYTSTLVALDHRAAGDVAAAMSGARLLAELLCRCPAWPTGDGLAAPPVAPPWLIPTMTPPELLVYGARLLTGADRLRQPDLRLGLARLGRKALQFSIEPDQ